MIIKGKYHVKDEISLEAKELLLSMMEVNPKKRISISKIIAHPWL